MASLAYEPSYLAREFITQHFSSKLLNGSLVIGQRGAEQMNGIALVVAIGEYLQNDRTLLGLGTEETVT